MCCYGDKLTNGEAKCRIMVLLILCSIPCQFVQVLQYTVLLKRLLKIKLWRYVVSIISLYLLFFFFKSGNSCSIWYPYEIPQKNRHDYICQSDAWLPVSYLTNRFHVAVRLFSNRSQMTSKCRKNKEVAHEPHASVSLLFLPHFDVFCDLLLNRPTATWNLSVLYNDQKRKRPIHIPASNRLTFWGFVLV